jgi:hypothetical protein
VSPLESSPHDDDYDDDGGEELFGMRVCNVQTNRRSSSALCIVFMYISDEFDQLKCTLIKIIEMERGEIYR